MKQIWRYLMNIFYNTTRTSYKKMLLILRDHAPRLDAEKADPEINSLLIRTTPVIQDYQTSYGNWSVAKGNQEGETKRFNLKLEELSEVKMKEWEPTVSVVFSEDSPDYLIIFPHGRTGFRLGAYDIRIQRVSELAGALAAYPVFADLKTEVSDYCRELETHRNNQKKAVEKVKSLSVTLEEKRVAAAEMLYGNLGFLMNKYRANPLQVEKYFDLSLLRSTISNGSVPPPEPLTGKVAKLSMVTLLEGGFDANSYFHIVNIGGTLLRAYTTKLPSDPVSPSAIELQPGEETFVFASELGADSNMYLMVYNPDTALEGEYSFLLIPGPDDED
jgi:hypothetical protein